MTPVLYAPIAVPVAVAALCALAGHPRRAAWAARVARWSSTASALAQLAAGIALGTAVVQDGPLASGPLRADGLSAFMVLVIGAVAVIATWSAAHDLAPGGDPAAVRRHLVLVQLFLAAMAAAVLADNLGLVWVALEATTIVTAFLVGHHRDRAARRRPGSTWCCARSASRWRSSPPSASTSRPCTRARRGPPP